MIEPIKLNHCSRDARHGVLHRADRCGRRGKVPDLIKDPILKAW